MTSGDEVRLSKSPDPTFMGQTASWLNKSRYLTLSTPVTENIDTFNSVLGTPSTNVTAVLSSSSARKEGNRLLAITLGASFTTGLAYYSVGDMGPGKDLSSYQQISFYLYCSRTIANAALSIKLYSNNDGTGEVASFSLPYSNNISVFTGFTLDLGSALSASVKSWGLFVNTSFGASTDIWFDNMLACKAPSEPDSLNLTSLVGKGIEPRWLATTSYSTEDKVSSRAISMNCMIYKCVVAGISGTSDPVWPDFIGDTVIDGSVTWENIGFEESWYTVKSINGTQIELNQSSNIGAGQGYYGNTESAAIYKRETFKTVRAASLDTVIDYVPSTKNFSAARPIVVQGGWDPDINELNGETFLDGASFMGSGFVFWNNRFIHIENVSFIRYNYGIGQDWAEGSAGIVVRRSYAISNIEGFHNFIFENEINETKGSHRNFHCKAVQNSVGFSGSFPNGYMRCCYSHSNTNAGIQVSHEGLELIMTFSKYNGTYGFNGSTSFLTKMNRFETADNSTSAIHCRYNITARNCKFDEPTELTIYQNWFNTMVFSENHDQVEGNHVILMDRGQAIIQSSVVPPGYSKAWRVSPTSMDRGSKYPIRFFIGKVAVKAGELATVSILALRTNTALSARLILPEGMVRGVPFEVVSDMTVPEDTWETLQISFTPKQQGVLPFYVYVWGGSTYHCYLTGISFKQG
jgi:hypothetical protein